jgi:hypothetical protein
MDEHHAHQHEAQLSALRSIGDSPPGRIDTAMQTAHACLRQVLEHMDREEREIFDPALLLAAQLDAP